VVGIEAPTSPRLLCLGCTGPLRDCEDKHALSDRKGGRELTPDPSSEQTSLLHRKAEAAFPAAAIAACKSHDTISPPLIISALIAIVRRWFENCRMWSPYP